LSTLSHEDQRFATLFGAKALANQAMFEIARNFHYEIQNKTNDAGGRLVSLFAKAIEKKDFRDVRMFVELLDEWTTESVEIVDGAPGFGFSIPFAKDPVGMALLMRAEVEIRLSGRPTNDDIDDNVKLVRLEAMGYTARSVLEWLKIKAPGFKCDVKTIRNRARELGVKLLPDSRGLRKGQKRNTFTGLPVNWENSLFPIPFFNFTVRPWLSHDSYEHDH
jgi:hypothetical protein